jgi:hypothetical protein
VPHRSAPGDSAAAAGFRVSNDRPDDHPGEDADLGETLPRPQDFAALTDLVPREQAADSVASGPDPDKHAAQVRKYLDAGVDEVYVPQIGPDMDGFFSAWERDILPQLRG